MIGVLIVTHGSLAIGLKNAAQVIVGEVNNIETIGLNAGDDVNLLAEKIKIAVQKLDIKDGLIIFVDLVGASPYNQSLIAINGMDEAIKNKAYIVSGANIPMLLEAINSQFLGMDIGEAIKNIANEGKSNIEVWNNKLVSDKEEDDF